MRAAATEGFLFRGSGVCAIRRSSRRIENTLRKRPGRYLEVSGTDDKMGCSIKT